MNQVRTPTATSRPAAAALRGRPARVVSASPIEARAGRPPRRSPRQARQLPPRPDLNRFAMSIGFMLTPTRFLDACQRRCGDWFTFRPAPDRHIVVTSDPEAVKQVFTGDPNLLYAGAGQRDPRPDPRLGLDPAARRARAPAPPPPPPSPVPRQADAQLRADRRRGRRAPDRGLATRSHLPRPPGHPGDHARGDHPRSARRRGPQRRRRVSAPLAIAGHDRQPRPRRRPDPGRPALRSAQPVGAS